MFVNLVIGLVLFLGLYTGARRGLVLQGIHMIGYVLTWVCAGMFYRMVAQMIEMLVPYPSDAASSQFMLYNLIQNVEFDKTFYNALAYVMILVLGGLVTKVVASLCSQITKKVPLVNTVNGIGGAVLGLFVTWLKVFFVLSLLSIVPIQMIQDIFSPDALATFIVKQTPIASDVVVSAWLMYK